MIEVGKHSLKSLEWAAFQAELCQRSKSESGNALAASWGPGILPMDRVQIQSKAVIEMLDLFSNHAIRSPYSRVNDLKELFKRINRFGQIDLEEFVWLIDFQRSALDLHHFIRKHFPANTALKEVFSALDKLEAWYDSHARLLDSRGDIVNDATSDLAALRELAKELHDKISRRLEDYLKSSTYASLLQDHYVTLRDGRYVLPIKANFKGRIPGIIHDVSNSEATLFVEPEDVVDWNNQLKITEKEIQREIEKILSDVVRNTQPFLDKFLENQELLALSDVLGAYVELCATVGGELSCVEWGDDLDFQDLSHPLLALERSVVRNDIAWQHAFVLTGPNTGGKTILLKSVGINVCLASTGLPVFAKSARIPSDLEKLFVCIGDEQNLKQNLSTFSAHLSALSEIFEGASERALVLIDEIATGTSPEEGQPLAQAFIEKLLDKKVKLFVTTHYGALKQFALTDPRCRIASMAFDENSRKPTYELIMDIPGESSAFDTAASLGFDSSVLDRARQLRGEPSEDLTLAVKSLDEARKKFLKEKTELSQQLERAKLREIQAQKSIEEYGLKQNIKLTEEAEKLLKDVNQIRTELNEKIAALKDAELKDGAKAEFQKISDLGTHLRVQVDEIAGLKQGESRGVGDESLELGQIVEIDGLGLGEIVDLPKSLSLKSMITVQVGELKSRIPRERLKTVKGGRARSFKRNLQSMEASRQAPRNTPNIKSGLSSNLVCDLRGKTVEDSLRKVENMLNTLIASPQSKITIIHGHGTSRLKDAIRDYLTKTRPDVVYRPGSWPGEGGDGVTVVELEE